MPTKLRGAPGSHQVPPRLRLSRLHPHRGRKVHHGIIAKSSNVEPELHGMSTPSPRLRAVLHRSPLGRANKEGTATMIGSIVSGSTRNSQSVGMTKRAMTITATREPAPLTFVLTTTDRALRLSIEKKSASVCKAPTRGIQSATAMFASWLVFRPKHTSR